MARVPGAARNAARTKTRSVASFAPAPAQALIATTTGLQLVTYTALSGTTLTVNWNGGEVDTLTLSPDGTTLVFDPSAALAAYKAAGAWKAGTRATAAPAANVP